MNRQKLRREILKEFKMLGMMGMDSFGKITPAQSSCYFCGEYNCECYNSTSTMINKMKLNENKNNDNILLIKENLQLVHGINQINSFKHKRLINESVADIILMAIGDNATGEGGGVLIGIAKILKNAYIDLNSNNKQIVNIINDVTLTKDQKKSKLNELFPKLQNDLNDIMQGIIVMLPISFVGSGLLALSEAGEKFSVQLLVWIIDGLIKLMPGVWSKIYSMTNTLLFGTPETFLLSLEYYQILSGMEKDLSLDQVLDNPQMLPTSIKAEDFKNLNENINISKNKIYSNMIIHNQNLKKVFNHEMKNYINESVKKAKKIDLIRAEKEFLTLERKLNETFSRAKNRNNSTSNSSVGSPIQQGISDAEIQELAKLRRELITSLIDVWQRLISAIPGGGTMLAAGGVSTLGNTISLAGGNTVENMTNTTLFKTLLDKAKSGLSSIDSAGFGGLITTFIEWAVPIAYLAITGDIIAAPSIFFALKGSVKAISILTKLDESNILLDTPAAPTKPVSELVKDGVYSALDYAGGEIVGNLVSGIGSYKAYKSIAEKTEAIEKILKKYEADLSAAKKVGYVNPTIDGDVIDVTPEEPEYSQIPPEYPQIPPSNKALNENLFRKQIDLELWEKVYIRRR